MRELVCVAMAGGAVYCAECADEKFDGDFPDDSTPVYEDDDWRAEVGGICPGCKEFVNGADS